jgi:hypothetical protein
MPQLQALVVQRSAQMEVGQAAVRGGQRDNELDLLVPARPGTLAPLRPAARQAVVDEGSLGLELEAGLIRIAQRGQELPLEDSLWLSRDPGQGSGPPQLGKHPRCRPGVLLLELRELGLPLPGLGEELSAALGCELGRHRRCDLVGDGVEGRLIKAPGSGRIGGPGSRAPCRESERQQGGSQQAPDRMPHQATRIA